MIRPSGVFVSSWVWVVVLSMVASFVPMSAVEARAQISDASQAEPWKLDFEKGKFGAISVRNKAGRVRTLHYLVFKLTNESGSDVPLALHFRLATDVNEKDVYRETVDAKAAEAVAKHLGKKELVARADRPATLADGDSIECVALFGPIDSRWDELTMTVHGLEDVVYRNGGKRFFRRRAMVMEWERPGDEFFTQRDRIKFKKAAWKTTEGPREIR